jgi:hypothetical protein
MEDFMRILKWSKMKPLRFKKGGKLQGLGANTKVSYTGNRNPRGRRG